MAWVLQGWQWGNSLKCHLRRTHAITISGGKSNILIRVTFWCRHAPTVTAYLRRHGPRVTACKIYQDLYITKNNRQTCYFNKNYCSNVTIDLYYKRKVTFQMIQRIDNKRRLTVLMIQKVWMTRIVLLFQWEFLCQDNSDCSNVTEDSCPQSKHSDSI